MAGLVLKNVFKRYPNGFEAVKNFNIEIEDKEFIVLVGPSGCGKSTTLRMIAGLEENSEGELYIGDRLVNDVAPKDRDIAMVFQNYALYPHMTVYDNMAFALKLRKIPKNEINAKVEAAAKILDIEDLLKRKPKQLSGGQRQRVALGRAIVRDPKVFLMDEPLSNLDAKLRVQMRAEISKLHHRLKTTFIYVTHDQTEAMTMGTRIVVMKDGLVQQMGNPQTIYENPDNMFVATFIGSPQMNMIDAEIIANGKQIFASFSGFKMEIPGETKQLQKYNGKKVVLGIRPEDMSVVEESGINIIEADIDVTELLGSETILYLTMGNQQLIGKVDPKVKVSVGSTVKLLFNTNKLHVFDKETEKAVF
jgi:multiple sugar transport system ATP-binding protein